MAIVNTPPRKWGKYLRRLSILGAAMLIAVILLFFSLPFFLIRPAETLAADGMLYFSPLSAPTTEQYVAELYQQGLTKKIVCLSGQITWQVFPADFAREHLISLGLPATDVTAYHPPSTDCEAAQTEQLLKFVKEQNWKQVLIVTNPTASRAAHRALATRFAEEQIKLAITYAPVDRDALRGQWWKQHDKVQQIVQQSLEITLDWLYPTCQ